MPGLWSAWGAVIVAIWVSGCLPPPRMELSHASTQAGHAGVWWSVPAGAVSSGPIIAVEQRLSHTRVRQWLIDDRGVRVFEYRRGRTASCGPPLSTSAQGDDFGGL